MCDCLHLPQWILKFHSSYELTEKDYQDGPKVERCIAKALQLGVRTALEDLPGRGRRARISDEDKTWVVNLACQKPKELGYAQEL